MNFAQSSSGRLFTLGFGLAFIGGGAAALATGGAATALLSAGLLLGVVCGILAVAVGLGDHPNHTVLALIGLPFALFLYSLAQGLLAQSHHAGAAYGLVVLGLAAVARAAFVASDNEAPEAHVSSSHQAAAR